MPPNPQSLVPNPDQRVRRIDEDRWLASRFAPADVRRRLIALYELNYEIARTAETVSQGAIGDIKLAWWREALAEIAAGKRPRAHPVLAAFAEAVDGAAISWPVLEALIDARAADLDAQPFATWDALEAYIDATAGGLMRVALTCCNADAPDELVRSAGQAWGLVGLARVERYWRGGRSVLPRAGGSVEDMLARAEQAYARVRRHVVSSAAFPALGYVRFVPAYVRAGRPHLLQLARQLSLIAGAASGKL